VELAQKPRGRLEIVREKEEMRVSREHPPGGGLDREGVEERCFELAHPFRAVPDVRLVFVARGGEVVVHPALATKVRRGVPRALVELAVAPEFGALLVADLAPFVGRRSVVV
jgi:hypothetical protein